VPTIVTQHLSAGT